MIIKQEKLNGIYNRPSYYDSYYSKRIPSDLNAHGSTSAKENDTSIVATFVEVVYELLFTIFVNSWKYRSTSC